MSGLNKIVLLKGLAVGGAAVSVGAAFVQYRREMAKQSAKREKEESKMDESDKKRARVAVNAVFFARLRKLVGWVIPGFRSKEFMLLLIHTFFLVSRTVASIYIAQLDGKITKSLVQKKPKVFLRLLATWLLTAIPVSYINSMIRYLESKLGIAFRTRLVNKCYAQYMRNDTYYKVSNLDSRLSNPDQCLTEDIGRWCEDLAHLYGQLSKPMLDIVLISYQLHALGQGGSGTAAPRNERITSGVIGLMTGIVTAVLLKSVTPPFGRMVSEQAKAYGELRAAHSRLITHSEEIAFYQGHVVEESVLRAAYTKLVKSMDTIFKSRIFYTMCEQYSMKYCWSAAGLVMIALPSFARTYESAEGAELDGAAVGERTQDFVVARGMLTNAADATERIMSSWKEVAEFAGRTERVNTLLEVFDDMENDVYVKHQTSASNESGVAAQSEATADSPDLVALSSEDEDTLVVKANDGKDAAPVLSVGENPSSSSSSSTSTHTHIPGDQTPPPRALRRRSITPHTLGLMRGAIIDDVDYIELKNVPIITPSGDTLIGGRGINMKITKGMHLLITGPNGCGKSSLFRMIGGLWPIRDGTMWKPSKGDMFYIPQRPYLTQANLREQFIYPDTSEDFEKKGLTDADLLKILSVVDLAHVVKREGGWDSCKNWRDVLSGGEKQRVGMARVFYHKPLFAILDECTSAVSLDVEGDMYNYAKASGITLLTVTHRPSLWKYHTHILTFDGCGGYKIQELSREMVQSHIAGARSIE